MRDKEICYTVDLKEPPQKVGLDPWHEFVVVADAPSGDQNRPTPPEAFLTWAEFWNQTR